MAGCDPLKPLNVLLRMNFKTLGSAKKNLFLFL